MIRLSGSLVLGLAAVAGCELASRSAGEYVEPRPQLGEQQLAKAAGISHLHAPEGLKQVAGLGDIDGDGYDDLIIAIGDNPPAVGPIEIPKSGRAVYLIYGRRDGLPARADVEALSDAVFTLDANAAVLDAAALGDIDGDGLHDVAITQQAIPDEGVTPYRSRVFVLWGNATRFAGALAITTATELALDVEGTARARDAGDLDGDGFDEIAITMPTSPASSQAIGLSFGHPRPWSFPLEQPDSMVRADDGQWVIEFGEGIGDLDGDGAAELVVLSYPADLPFSEASRVSLFFGGSDAWAADRSVLASDAHVEDELSLWWVRPADLSGDARADLVLYRYALNESPVAKLLALGPTRPTGEIRVEWPAAGTSLCSHLPQVLGDVNGDGRTDLAVGLCWDEDAEPRSFYESEVPRVAVLYGWPDGATTLAPSDIDATFELPHEYYVVRSPGIGDFNGDGFADYAIASDSWPAGLVPRSPIHLVYGAAQ